jgi:hypothetical protein
MRFSDVIGLDPRSIGLLRIGIAVCLLIDLGGRAADLEAHYTDAGLLPRDAAIETADAWHISLHFANGQYAYQAILFAMAALSALCLLVGVQTRLAAIASWVFIVSLQNRNFIILNGADVLLRMTLFWSLFLPLGARFSVDRLRGISRPAAETNWVAHSGTVFYLLQFMLVYVFAGLIKSDIPAWREGTGLAYALRSPEFVDPLGLKFVENAGAMRFFNGVVVYGELFGSFLLLLPVWNAAARIAVVVAFRRYLLIGATMSVGMFPVVASSRRPRFCPRNSGIERRVSSREGTLRGARRGTPSSWLRSPIRARLDPCRCASPLASRGSALFGAGCRPRSCSNPQRTLSPFSYRRSCSGSRRRLRLEQRWDMFAAPPPAGGWFVIPGRLTSGAEVDLANMKPNISWRSPLPSATLTPTPAGRSIS